MAVTRASWLTEKEICDQIWGGVDRFLTPATQPFEGELYWLREYPLLDGEYVADFVGFGVHKNKLEIFVVEAKITADIYTVSQLVEYLNIFENTVIGMDIKVNGLIAARYFDKSVYPLAQHMGLTLIRVFTEKKKVSCGFEDGYQSTEHCRSTLQKLIEITTQLLGAR